MKIFYESYQYGGYLIFNDADDRTIYIQCDYEFPSLAITFGWSGKDGMAEEIESAITYLDDNAGIKVEDPGYFDGE